MRDRSKIDNLTASKDFSAPIGSLDPLSTLSEGWHTDLLYYLKVPVCRVPVYFHAVPAKTRQALAQLKKTTSLTGKYVESGSKEDPEVASRAKIYKDFPKPSFARAHFYTDRFEQSGSGQCVADSVADSKCNRSANLDEHVFVGREPCSTVPPGPGGRVHQWFVFLEFCSTELYRVYEFIRRVLH